MDASWQPTRLIRVFGVQVCHKIPVQNEGLGDPQPLLGTVALPVHGVLVPLPQDLMSKIFETKNTRWSMMQGDGGAMAGSLRSLEITGLRRDK